MPQYARQVRQQPLGVGTLLSPWGLWPGTQVTRLVSKYLYPLSRLTSPQHFFKVQTSRLFCHGVYFNEEKEGLWHLKFKNSPRARCGASRL